MKNDYFSQLKRLMSYLLGETLRFFVRFYQCCISPFMVNSCRYYPSCSVYCKESIHRFGAVKGCLLTVKRLVRCHPFTLGGYDPIPEKGKD